MAVCLWLLALATSARGDSVGSIAEAIVSGLRGAKGAEPVEQLSIADLVEPMESYETSGANGAIYHGHPNHSHQNKSHNKSHHPSPSPGPEHPVNSWCDNHQATGWPTFNSQSELSSDSKWSKYFKIVYGEVPTFGYPICVGGMYLAHKDALQHAGIPTTHFWEVKKYRGGVNYVIWHGGNQAFKSNTWVEGFHCTATREHHSAWYWNLPGSGIWLWSGKTDVFGHRQESWQKYLGTTKCGHDFECGGKLFTTAKSKFGIDTVQYTKETDRKMFLQPGSTGNTYMFVVTTGVGSNTCGATKTKWKAGWQATKSCDCDQSQKCQNCKGFGPAALGYSTNTSSSPCFV